MPYVTLSNSKTVDLTHAEIKTLSEKTRLKVICYHSTSPVMYKYVFSNGYTEQLTKKGAKVYCAINQVKIKSGGPLGYSTQDIYSEYNPALGQYVSGKSEYNRILKEKGLIEVGEEKSAFDAIEQKQDYGFTHDDIKEAVNAGAEISDSEAGALISGEI